MPSEVNVNALLRTLSAIKPNGSCLELGTGTGLASSWIVDGLSINGHLVTVDNEQKWLNIAQKHLGSDPRISIVESDAEGFLISENEKSNCYDLIFADTWAGKYSSLDLALNLLAPGGIYIIDDMLPQENWPDGHEIKVKQLIEELKYKKSLKVCSLIWACGVIIATKI